MAELIADPFRAARLLLHLRQEGVTDADVLSAMETIDRSVFSDRADAASLAFEDAMLAIPCGQVILRPALTGHLIQALRLKPARQSRVLLVGFGAGYMTALLAQLAGHVYAIDRYRTLVEAGRERLGRLGIGNVSLRHADGLEGWPEQGPFDAVVLAGAVPRAPDALGAQLARGGILAAPIAMAGENAELQCLDGGLNEIERRPLFQWVPPLSEGVAEVL